MARILVVDDDDSIREMLRAMLERDGHEVVDASNGVEAIALYRLTQVDVVITNILMPEKEGLETIRELREEFPDVKIIAMSGGGQLGTVSYLEVARAFGAIDTLPKPIERTRLREAIALALDPPARS